MARLSTPEITYFLMGLGIGLLLAYQMSILFASSLTICSWTDHPHSVDQTGDHPHSMAGGWKEEPIVFSDEKYHNDNSIVSDDLAKRVRVLCMVLTHYDQHKTHAVHVQATWGKRCNKLVIVSDKEDDTLPVFVVPSAYKKGRNGIGEKIIQGFDHVYQKYSDEADWFLKADDDTYVVVENLRYFLSSQNTSESIFFGHGFKSTKQNVSYFSGGAGYVLSREALRRYAHRPPGLCPNKTSNEDVIIGKCLHDLGVAVGDSLDVIGRSRFHPFDPNDHLAGRYPDWYYPMDFYGGVSKGLENISDYAITFHYIHSQLMYLIELYIYHIQPYGVIYGLQDLNQPRINANDLSKVKTNII